MSVGVRLSKSGVVGDHSRDVPRDALILSEVRSEPETDSSSAHTPHGAREIEPAPLPVTTGFNQRNAHHRRGKGRPLSCPWTRVGLESFMSRSS